MWGRRERKEGGNKIVRESRVWGGRGEGERVRRET